MRYKAGAALWYSNHPLLSYPILYTPEEGEHISGLLHRVGRLELQRGVVISAVQQAARLWFK